MSKRLTEEARSKWAGIPLLLKSRCGTGAAFLDTEDLRALVESEKASWEEVERLKGQLQTVESSKQTLIEQLTDEVALHARSCAKVEMLQSQLKDALTVISDALTDIMDMLEVSEMEHRDMELCPQANMLSLHDELQAAIDRIQEVNS